MAIDGERLSRKAWLRLIGASVATSGAVVVGVYGWERWTLYADQFTLSYGTPANDPFFKFEMPGMVRPKVVEASQAWIGSDERVIGFVVGGRARAYRLEALADRSRHIVNDVVGDVPLTVTYCDRSQCVRAFTGQKGQGALNVATAGLYQAKEMIIRVDEVRYFQNTGLEFEPASAPSTLPLESIEPTLTTWGEWKRDHPETDVYEGYRRRIDSPR